LAEIDIVVECGFKSKKSVNFAKYVIKEYSSDETTPESFKEIEKKLVKNNYFVEELYIDGCSEFEVTGPFEIGDKIIGMNIWGGHGADDFFHDLAGILIELDAQHIYAIYFHDDGFRWFDALVDGQLKTIYSSDSGGDFDSLFFEEDALAQFKELYKQKKPSLSTFLRLV